MEIKILGTGCPKCKTLEENAKKAVAEKNIDATIIKITKIDEIIEYGVMSTPAIIIDEEIKSYGKLCTVEEIKEWL